MGVAAETKEAEVKDFPILQLGKKENPPTPTRNSRWRRLCEVLDEPPSANLFLFLIACAKRCDCCWNETVSPPSPPAFSLL